MKDIQNVADERGISIQKVGIKDVRLPFLIKTQQGDYQSVLSNIRITVELPMEFKGTHMSRFVEVLNDWRQKPFSSREMELILMDVIERLSARSAHMQIEFKYFVEKEAPISRIKGVVDYNCSFTGELNRDDGFDFMLGVAVPFTSLCPCSKEISKYGAHNQRGEMRAKVKYARNSFVWIEDLISLMEAQGSSPVYSLLKREDEKYVTERAYDNPKFVEDVLRDLVLALRPLPGLIWFDVECENYESIHNHSAYATHAEYIKMENVR